MDLGKVGKRKQRPSASVTGSPWIRLQSILPVLTLKRPYVICMATTAEVLLFEEGSARPIVLSQHFDGSEIHITVARAMRRAEKSKLLCDPASLGRMIFEEMLRFDKSGDFGISLERDPYCFYTIEVYSSWESRPEFVLNGDFYEYEEFVNEFAPIKKTGKKAKS